VKLRCVAGILGVLPIAACQPEDPAKVERSEVATEPPPPVIENRVAAMPAEPGRTSQFTNLDPATCAIVAESPEGPYWRRLCPGVGGYSVEWAESDLRQGLELIDADGKRSGLRLSELVANGAFNRLGPRIEWRGRNGQNPETLSVRMFVANGADPDAPDRSMLAIARLRPTPCLVAIVPPGPGQSAEARQIADGRLPDCMG
jgi:hypothetical protein